MAIALTIYRLIPDASVAIAIHYQLAINNVIQIQISYNFL